MARCFVTAAAAGKLELVSVWYGVGVHLITGVWNLRVWMEYITILLAFTL